MGHLKVFLYPRIIKSAFYFVVNTPVTTFRSRYRCSAPPARSISGRESLWDGVALGVANQTGYDYKWDDNRLKRETGNQSGAKQTKNTLRDSVCSSLKTMIVTGQIPPGSRVTETTSRCD
ncbi:hypothetical protein [Mesorhizobium qingshengii]|uniref:Uncharacterized protein n=1 Tax=Mesorhizobium qingshengii TaxID=1165689 RepID=A0A1G5VV29_9HYPH|nr:hypothetical protein [Mesorhizobium qingshengii]SDA49713.1 hypothetical protein SAMN02927914_00811 [Mesorhizobium qingshengii]